MVPNDTRIEFPANATYRIDNPVPIVDKTGLSIQGNGTTLLAEKAGLLFVGGGTSAAGNPIIVNNFKIRGSNAAGGVDGPYDPEREDQHCLSIRGVHGFGLTNCEHSNPWGDAFYTGTRKVGPASGGPASYDPSSDVWVSGCYFHNTGRQGITIQGIHDVIVSSNWIFQARRSILEMEPTAEAFNGVDNLHFRGNKVGDGRLNFIANHGSGPVNNIWIEDNYVRNGLNITVEDQQGGRRAGWHVNRNTTAGELPGNPAGRVMEFINVDGVEVTENVQDMQPGRDMSLVVTTDCTEIDVRDNTIKDGVEHRTIEG